jgi:hypothetical protein
MTKLFPATVTITIIAQRIKMKTLCAIGNMKTDSWLRLVSFVLFKRMRPCDRVDEISIVVMELTGWLWNFVNIMTAHSCDVELLTSSGSRKV